MVWVIAAVCILFVLGRIGSSIAEAERKNQLNDDKRRKIDAYADYLKRTSAKPELQGMSENEVKEYVHQQMKKYSSNIKSSLWVPGGIFLVAIAIGLGAAFGPDKNWKAMIIIFIIGYAIGEMVAQSKKKKIDQALIADGLDPVRLKLED